MDLDGFDKTPEIYNDLLPPFPSPDKTDNLSFESVIRNADNIANVDESRPALYELPAAAKKSLGILKQLQIGHWFLACL